MSIVTCDLALSADGYVAGPHQSFDTPLGVGGLQLHHWHFDPEGRAKEIVDAWMTTPGAHVMGRNMFDHGRGDWDPDWRGWWGEDPPYHTPVFVLTHYPREPLPMEGGTTFYFVTDGVESAMRQAREAAGDRPVAIAGGASTVNQFLAARLIDRLNVHITPYVLGGGERLFEGVPSDLQLEIAEVEHTPGVTHLSYQVLR
jgi:dihydrofolate reductase